MHHRSRSLFSALPLTLLLAGAALAQVVTAPVTPKIGSSHPVSPEPPVARPSTPPCTVPLLTEQAFADFNNKPITYTPPAGCKGPWAKVVFSADFTVTAGRQFDRTAQVFLGGANLYFGTTAEPRATLSPSWHVERDVTDLSALFHNKQVGQAILGNFVGTSGGVVYDGVIYANARLQFYPSNAANPAPAVPNEVLGFPTNGTTFVNTTTDQSTGTFTFPKNLERVYLDVIAQSQSTDEQWFDCVTNDVAASFGDCGNAAFRETEVSIDGKPAGVAPVYPWIYTGGIDPYLWEPITGLETLNLKPYRVDLSPFAGVLADGKQHTVAVSVFHADTGFDLASTLLLYTGPANSVTTGGLLTDTLSADPSPNIQDYLNTAADGTVSGPISVSSSRAWTISGYINTSHGRIETSINAFNNFKNTQDVKVSNTTYKQDVLQDSTQQETTTVQAGNETTQTQHNVSFPIVVNYNQSQNADGTYAITSYVKQTKYEALRSPIGANSPNPVVTNETVESADTLHYSASFSFLGHDGDHATAIFAAKDAEGNCSYRQLTSVGVILTGLEDSTSCSYAP